MGSTVLTPPKPKRPKKTAPPRRGNNGHGGPGGSGGSGRDGHREPPRWSIPPDAYRVGMWTALVSITMLFLALIGAMMVRAGTARNWVHIQPPRLLYFNTLVLLMSSLTLEMSKRLLRKGASKEFTHWLYITAALGITFLAGQFAVWRQLDLQGIYLSTNPSSAFFYVLTALHALHILGGILALFYLVIRRRQIIQVPGKQIILDVSSIYWHYLDVLWLGLFILLTMKL